MFAVFVLAPGSFVLCVGPWLFSRGVRTAFDGWWSKTAPGSSGTTTWILHALHAMSSSWSSTAVKGGWWAWSPRSHYSPKNICKCVGLFMLVFAFLSLSVLHHLLLRDRGRSPAGHPERRRADPLFLDLSTSICRSGFKVFFCI